MSHYCLKLCNSSRGTLSEHQVFTMACQPVSLFSDCISYCSAPHPLCPSQTGLLEHVPASGHYPGCSHGLEISSPDTSLCNSLTFFLSLLTCHLLNKAFCRLPFTIVASFPCSFQQPPTPIFLSMLYFFFKFFHSSDN